MKQTRHRRSRADETYDRLRRMIVTLELRPGEILLEKEFCARFAVSRTPLREAMLRLAEHGLVDIAPQHGTFVSSIDPDAVRQAHFLRENLEVPIVLRLCEEDGLDLASLKEVILEQQVALARNDFADFLPLDDDFHRGLFELAGMSEIWGAIHAKKAHLDRIRFLQAPQRGKLAQLVREHEAIIDAVARHDGPEAERVVRIHLSGAIAFLEQLCIEQPGLLAGSERP